MPRVCVLFLVFMNQTDTKKNEEIKMHQIDVELRWG